ncbi:four helix bundle protein [uncultured Candidatus Kuenenia sp.]|uniref:four helix bundle protein n=1 Tax=Candidatus Kuenenia sp. TaxID=2499824 RepID=UPI001DBA52F6|nr:four helix bundle protein [uncultured Candidatus Kuenenia sp.]MBE7548636.1 four helix bundle protein [Planctomycetia bacterium]MCF6151987.1 four helix bundle protein [Candidatus Kuenenia stuttgartiensis]
MDYRPHRKLDVWKKSMEFVRDIYQTTEQFPKTEIYGLISQMRRASISIPSNLAEGAARKGSKEFKQFINIAQGSISELDTQVELARMLNYIEEKAYKDMIEKLNIISKMLFGLSRSLSDK